MADWSGQLGQLRQGLLVRRSCRTQDIPPVRGQGLAEWLGQLRQGILRLCGVRGCRTGWDKGFWCRGGVKRRVLGQAGVAREGVEAGEGDANGAVAGAFFAHFGGGSGEEFFLLLALLLLEENFC
jgi:hypothetical protein